MTQTKSSDVFLKVQQRVAAVQAAYASTNRSYSNFLIYGDFGTGKTQLTTTCPRPVFIDSFDPGGTKTAALQPLIQSGDIIVENKWEDDSWKSPRRWMEWEREMEARIQEGFFEYFGTYVLDSITKWADCLLWEILRRGTPGKGSRAGKHPELQDYGVQQMTTVDWLGVMMGLPCHVMVTGHIGLIKDEVTGGLETGLMLSGKLSEKVPLVFDEKYITWAKEGPQGAKYQLQTRNDGKYKAETRMGGMKFDLYEEPNIRALLKKAGRSADDKPPIPPPSAAA